MSIANLIDAYFRNKWEATEARGVVFPVTGAGAGTGLGAVCTAGAALTWGAWQDIALPALITVPTIAVAIFVNTPNNIETYAVQLGSTRSVSPLGVHTVYVSAATVTAAGAAAILGAARTEVRQIHVAVAAILGAGMLSLEVPVVYNPGDGILARVSTISGADTYGVSVLCYTGLKWPR